ncbi:tetratricopeptide repeat protein [Sphingomonas sp. BN140010]|uniref:Tetratricopeptide repeat protein n=1 Tax=Sphingomonas arvum TaxID=2992113 RepID=A0ABT3JEJ0_9SPHN|nr:tetratricopeptide repeat protein [Sphingomonas sp. BN140010]MCW3797185.1 tetratricopeptide repeat protein [Sphingomonas sp. BN140010]
MIALLLAAELALAGPPASVSPAMVQAAHALDAGRTEQARRMIAAAVGQGAAEAEVDPLLARLALAEGRNGEALARLREVLRKAPDDTALLVDAATAAARLGANDEAEGFAQRAAARPDAGWQAFNLLGVLADRRRDWAAAEAAYAAALRRTPGTAAVLSNQGWSRLMQGQWREAEQSFAKAAALEPGNRLIADNLELARDALTDDLPRRRAGENDRDYAARLNDAGIGARLLGDEARATAAFTRAVEVRGEWYERAYNNLRVGQTTTR